MLAGVRGAGWVARGSELRAGAGGSRCRMGGMRIGAGGPRIGAGGRSWVARGSELRAHGAGWVAADWHADWPGLADRIWGRSAGWVARGWDLGVLDGWHPTQSAEDAHADTERSAIPDRECRALTQGIGPRHKERRAPTKSAGGRGPPGPDTQKARRAPAQRAPGPDTKSAGPRHKEGAPGPDTERRAPTAINMR